MEASGTFDIKTEHLDISVEGNGGIRLNRMSIRKIFEGDLKGKKDSIFMSSIFQSTQNSPRSRRFDLCTP